MHPNTRENALQAIRRAVSAVSGEKERRELKKGKPKSNTGMSSSNIVPGKRKCNPLSPSNENGSKRKDKRV